MRCCARTSDVDAAVSKMKFSELGVPLARSITETTPVAGDQKQKASVVSTRKKDAEFGSELLVFL
jgi:hypothetical protein